MAKIAFLKAPGCVNRDENGQKVVGRVLARCASGRRARAGPGACWAGCAPGSWTPPWGCVLGSRAHPQGTRWEAECALGSRVRAGAPGVAGHAPGGRLGGARRAGGGIWVVRANWAGGEAGRPPVAPATSARPARPRTAGLPTPCPRPAIRAFSRPPCKFGRFCTHRPPFASASRLIVSPLPTPIRENDDPPWASVCLLAASRVQNRPNLQKRRLFPRIGPRAAFCAQPPTGASRPRISWQPASLVCRVVGRRPAGPSAGARFFSAAGRLAWRRHARSPILIKFETPRGRAPRARPLAENARDLG